MAAFTSQEIQVWRQPIAKVIPTGEPPRLTLGNGAEVIPPPALLRHMRQGDELTLPAPQGLSLRPQFLASSRTSNQYGREIFLAPLSFVGAPRKNSRGEFSLLGEVAEKSLGIDRVLIPQKAVTTWFYRAPSLLNQNDSFYTILRIAPAASPAELRIAAKIRLLELERENASKLAIAMLERAFNILAHPDLRWHYDSWLLNPEMPLPFPYSGAGSIMVSGKRSTDGQTFFADRILSFRPDLCTRTISVRLRDCNFFHDCARYWDAGRRIEVWLDSSLLHTPCGPEWNQWKHHLGARVEIQADFVVQVRFRPNRGEFERSEWQIALPSRIRAIIPHNLDEQLAKAQQQHSQFGKYAAQIEEIRKLLETQALERAELRLLCDQCGIPSGFDITQITWSADYQTAFYSHLARAACRLYFFRSEYIFETQRAVVVETPEAGHATYVFRRPTQFERFLALYISVTKQDIRKNRQNVANHLGFVTRLHHGKNIDNWLAELTRYVGEPLSAIDAE